MSNELLENKLNSDEIRELSKERLCAICGKEIGDELIVNLYEKTICYACSNKIMLAIDEAEYGENEIYESTYTDNSSNIIPNPKLVPKSLTEVKNYDTCQIIKKVCKEIRGQDDLVKRVVYTILKNQKYPNRKSNILIVGNSGVGKTQTLESTLKLLDIPYVIEDITSCTEAGYIGRDVDELVGALYYKYNGSVSKIEKGVIVIDEFDKIARTDGNDVGKDVSGIGVQKSLLKLLEGKIANVQTSIYSPPIQVDTSNITFVLLGVFPDLKDIRKQRLRRTQNNKIGFITPKEQEEIYQNTSYIAEDFEKAGFMTEIIGRVNVFLEANELTQEDFYNILTKSKLSRLKSIRDEFKERKIRLVIKKEALIEIAKKAYSYKTGARAINTVLEDVFSDVLFKLDENLNNKYSYCLITANTVKNNKKYILK